MGVVNTTKSMQEGMRREMPVDEPKFDPGIDDPEAEDEADREGNTDPDGNALPAEDIMLRKVELIYPDPKSERWQLHLTGKFPSGAPFMESRVGMGNVSLAEFLRQLAVLQEPRSV